MKRELPTGNDGEEIFRAVKAHPEKFLDDLFVECARTTVNMIAHAGQGKRESRVIARQTASSVKMEWVNHAHEGLTVWYKDIIQMYTAETQMLAARGVVEVSRRSELIGFELTKRLESHIMQVVVTHDTYRDYTTWLKTQVN